MKETQARLESELRSGESGKQDLVQQRAELEQKLEAAQSESAGARTETGHLDA